MNPMLKPLGFLIGAWSLQLSNASFMPDPKMTIKGSAEVEALDEGDFIVMRQGTKGKGTPYATWIIGRDENSADYTVLYFDDRAVSRVYSMSLKSGTWKIWRSAPKFSQRFVGKVSKDKKTIRAVWEKSFDGKKWEHDFDMLYQKVS